MGFSVLLDTNVLIDILQKRVPNIDIVDDVLLELDSAEYCFSTLTIVDAYSIARVKDQDKYGKLLQVFSLLPVQAKTIDKAFSYRFKDFEDAIQLACAVDNKCDYLLTWNVRDYKGNKTKVKVMTPKQYLQKFGV